MSVKLALEDLARAKIYFHRHDVLRSMLALLAGLKKFLKTQPLNTERQAVEGVMRELVLLLNRTEEVKQYSERKALSWERKGAKRLLLEIAYTLRAYKEASEKESIEATRERKLKMDQLLLRGQKALEFKKLPEAEEAFQEAVTLYVDEHKLFYMIGSKLMSAGFARAAIKYLQKGVEVDPDSEKACYFLAKAFASIAEFDKAEASLLKAHELFGEDADRLSLYSNILIRQKRIGEAQVAARRALDLDPGHTEAKKILALVKKAGAKPAPTLAA
jgi:predicted Zn-dependent protease